MNQLLITIGALRLISFLINVLKNLYSYEKAPKTTQFDSLQLVNTTQDNYPHDIGCNELVLHSEDCLFLAKMKYRLNLRKVYA